MTGKLYISVTVSGSSLPNRWACRTAAGPITRSSKVKATSSPSPTNTTRDRAAAMQATPNHPDDGVECQRQDDACSRCGATHRPRC